MFVLRIVATNRGEVWVGGSKNKREEEGRRSVARSSIGMGCAQSQQHALPQTSPSNVLPPLSPRPTSGASPQRSLRSLVDSEGPEALEALEASEMHRLFRAFMHEALRSPEHGDVRHEWIPMTDDTEWVGKGAVRCVHRTTPLYHVSVRRDSVRWVLTLTRVVDERLPSNAYRYDASVHHARLAHEHARIFRYDLKTYDLCEEIYVSTNCARSSVRLREE